MRREAYNALLIRHNFITGNSETGRPTPSQNAIYLRMESHLCVLCAVICIRGTLSLDDCLTDAMCEPAEIDDWLAISQPGDQDPSPGQGPGHAEPDPAADTPNSLMAGARNSPAGPRESPRELDSPSSLMAGALNSPASAGRPQSNGEPPAGTGAELPNGATRFGGAAEARWQPLRGPLGGGGIKGGAAGADGVRGHGRGTGPGGAASGQAAKQRRAFTADLFSSSSEQHTPPSVQVQPP